MTFIHLAVQVNDISALWYHHTLPMSTIITHVKRLLIPEKSDVLEEFFNWIVFDGIYTPGCTRQSYHLSSLSYHCLSSHASSIYHHYAHKKTTYTRKSDVLGEFSNTF